MFFFQMPYLAEFWCWREDFFLINNAFVDGPWGCRKQGALSSDDIEAFKYNVRGPGSDPILVIHEE